MTSLPQFADEVHALKCELASEVLRRSGALRLQVTGSSMLPVVRPGDTLLVEGARAEEVLEGDIVLVGRDRRLCAHRVVRRLGGSRLLTRGDAMAAPDPIVSGEEVLGRVSFIVRNGRRIEASRKKRLLGAVIAALVRRSAVGARIVARLCARYPNY